jgi:hypothetical protein
MSDESYVQKSEHLSGELSVSESRSDRRRRLTYLERFLGSCVRSLSAELRSGRTAEGGCPYVTFHSAGLPRAAVPTSPFAPPDCRGRLFLHDVSLRRTAEGRLSLRHLSLCRTAEGGCPYVTFRSPDSRGRLSPRHPLARVTAVSPQSAICCLQLADGDELRWFRAPAALRILRQQSCFHDVMEWGF